MDLQSSECLVPSDTSEVVQASSCGCGTPSDQAKACPAPDAQDEEIRVRPFLFRTDEFWMDTDP